MCEGIQRGTVKNHGEDLKGISGEGLKGISIHVKVGRLKAGHIGETFCNTKVVASNKKSRERKVKNVTL
jgi:hypothetical protein